MSYLILHKVRGEPAFDIADKLQIGDEEGWVIPTSGHRAYPYKHWPLSELDNGLISHALGIPADWPDHYNVTKEPSVPKIGLAEVMAMIMPKIRRRI